MNEKQQSLVEEGTQLSLRDLLLAMHGWWNYLLKKWKILILAGSIGGGLGITYSIVKAPKYVGELTFVVEDSKSSPFAAYAGIASQFGIDLGMGGSGTGVFEGDNIIEFLKSRLMIEKALLSPVSMNGKVITLADLYIDFRNLKSAWKKPELAGISFPPHQNRKDFTLLQDSILYVLQKTIVRKNLQIKKPDKKLAFIEVTTTTENEIFSKLFTERLVKEATNFYINTKTQRNKINVNRLQSQADSIELLLNRKTYATAALQDLNLNPARQSASVNSELALRDKMVLQTMYAEVVKNLELSKLAMAQETPVIQIIDTPILPLRMERTGKLVGLILGSILAGICVTFFLIARKVYRDVIYGN